MARTPILGFDVEDPVQAELFVLAVRDGRITLTGPYAPARWYIEVGADEDPCPWSRPPRGT